MDLTVLVVCVSNRDYYEARDALRKKGAADHGNCRLVLRVPERRSVADYITATGDTAVSIDNSVNNVQYRLIMAGDLPERARVVCNLTRLYAAGSTA